MDSSIHRCGCTACQRGDSNPTALSHSLMNLFLFRLSHGMGRFYVGLEAIKRGRGSEKALGLIIGWSEDDISAARAHVEAIATTPARPAAAEGQAVILTEEPCCFTASGLPPGVSISGNTGCLSGVIPLRRDPDKPQ